jgi:hypothetical protein
MRRVRVIKSICLRIIDFRAQIEDFRKMLFEKKKFFDREFRDKWLASFDDYMLKKYLL